MDKNIENCFLCGAKCEKNDTSGASDVYVCPQCGVYEITYALLSIFEKKYSEKKHIIAGFLNEQNKNNSKLAYTLTTDSLQQIISDVRIPKTIMQKLEKFLLYCYRKNEFIGEEFTINSAHINIPGGRNRTFLYDNPMQKNIAYINKMEVEGVLYALCEIGWINIRKTTGGGGIVCFSLTTRGFEYAEKISTTNINSNKVFVAIEYHSDYLDRMSKAIIPACKACGFDAFIASATEHNNDINDEMIVDIKRSKFVVADLTNNNLGAYYEAGYAKGMGLQVIKCCSKNGLMQKT